MSSPPAKPGMLTPAELATVVCPTGGIAACDNGGECGMCLLVLPAPLANYAPGSKCVGSGVLPHCRAGEVEFGQLCDAQDYPRPVYTCGTSMRTNTCHGGQDVYVNVFCAGTSPQAPPPPPSPLPLAPPLPLVPPPMAPPPSPGVPPPAVVVSDPTTTIVVALCIPAGFLLLFCIALLVYRAVRRRSTARIEQEHRIYQAKLSDVSSEYNSSVLYAVKSIATYAHTSAGESVEMSTVKPTKSSEAEDCAVCMEAFKEGDIIKVLPCHHTVRLPAPGRSSSSLPPSPLCTLPDLPALVAVPHVLHRHVAARQGPRASIAFVTPARAADLPAVQGGADRSPSTGFAPSATRPAHGTRAPDCT
jgi:hypothetical protein